MKIDTDRIKAFVLDMDGVVTDTARLHAVAWKQIFDDYLEKNARESKRELRLFDSNRDYREYVDGKPRRDGVRSFLASRDIVLPEGEPGDGPVRGDDLIVRDLSDLSFAGNDAGTGRDLPSALDESESIFERLRKSTPAVFLDYDGTLTPIVHDPAEARLDEETRRTLQQLTEGLFVAVISGRGLADLCTLVGLEDLVYAGSHGFERTTQPAISPLPVRRWAGESLPMPGTLVASHCPKKKNSKKERNHEGDGIVWTSPEVLFTEKIQTEQGTVRQGDKRRL